MSGDASSPSHLSHTINLVDEPAGYSEAFVAGPMLVRMCSRCGCLILEGTVIVHDAWHWRRGQ